jgi:hypothetical protein
VVQVAEALRYKPEGHGFDFRRGFKIFHFSRRTVSLMSAQFLTEMSTRDLP